MSSPLEIRLSDEMTWYFIFSVLRLLAGFPRAETDLEDVIQFDCVLLQRDRNYFRLESACLRHGSV